MSEIRLIEKDTDLSKLKKPLGWDLIVNDSAYDVYRVDGYNHTIGGKWGENCYWACPIGEKPTYENLIEFNGDAPTWGITFDKTNYIKNKWDETSVEAYGSCWITRNGKNFYRILGRSMDYALAKAQYTLVKLQEECPLYLSERTWKKQAIGSKIWYHEQPAIIASVTSNNELWIEPDGIECFKAPIYWEHDDEYEEAYGKGMVVDLLDVNINWFREEPYSAI